MGRPVTAEHVIHGVLYELERLPDERWARLGARIHKFAGTVPGAPVLLGSFYAQADDEIMRAELFWSLRKAGEPMTLAQIDAGP